jgi:hypothetical protein
MDRILNLYKEYRDYIKHEDGLINQRLAWALTIQGFLFAAYALVLNKLIEIDRCVENIGRLLAAPLHGQAYLFLVLLCVIGVTICASAYGSIRAAENAIRAVRETFERMQPATVKGNRYFYQIDQASPARLPRLTAGGTWCGEARGARLASAIPAVLGLVWFLSLVATSYPAFEQVMGMVDETCPSPTLGTIRPKPRG